MWKIILFVLGLSFLVLMGMLRSLVLLPHDPPPRR